MAVACGGVTIPRNGVQWLASHSSFGSEEARALQDSSTVGPSAARTGVAVACGGVTIPRSGMVRPAGLEPATSWFVARRSIQLS